MNRIARVSFLLLGLAIFLVIGRIASGSFVFAVSDFWFIAGILLILLLSLVDQPHFSKDANVFVNATTAWVSLFVVDFSDRNGLWLMFAAWSAYLLVSSCVLMLLRNRPLAREGSGIQFFSRINRAIGRPEAIFSAFFLWGVFIQFSYPGDTIPINALLLFWAVFMILRVPAIASAIESLLVRRQADCDTVAGLLVAIHSPRIAEVQFSPELPQHLSGHEVTLRLGHGGIAAEGTIFDDRVTAGQRVGRIHLSKFCDRWPEVSKGDKILVEFKTPPSEKVDRCPLGVVCPGSSIGELILDLDPRIELHEGQVVTVLHSGRESYYQIVGARVIEAPLQDGNVSQGVRVVCGQLGLWESNRATFEPIDWVPPAGELVELCLDNSSKTVPKERAIVGAVPSSSFPIHVGIEDSITHNTALIGVTGSGKSYLAFHLIESYLDAGIKVLILDITRQHYQFLKHRKPTALKDKSEVADWMDDPDALLGIHQFATAVGGFPKATADYVEAAFVHLQGKVKLKAGSDAPAALCVVMEEAHALVPEWNQVAQSSDVQQVNRTARIVLQGRKFGLGSLLITQRTANVTKTILNQCNTIFALRSFDQTGLDFLKNYMGEAYSHSISTLPQFTAILVGKASSSARPIIFKIADLAKRWVPSSNTEVSLSGTNTTVEVESTPDDSTV